MSSIDESDILSQGPDETFELGRSIGESLKGGEMLMLTGGLGSGKTLLSKGILSGLGYDPDDVTSPSFTLINRYDTEKLTVYHIDLWRLDLGLDAGAAVGLDELLEEANAIAIIEWPDRLRTYPAHSPIVNISIEGSGDEPRRIEIKLDHVKS